VSAPGLERAVAALDPLGPVDARAMFGGHGLYVDGAMVAILAEGALYLKVDDQTRARFEQAGLDAFVTHSSGRPVRMSYHRAPEPIDDWDALRPYAEMALAAAKRARAARARSSARRRVG
jgi:DNA transformation protein